MARTIEIEGTRWRVKALGIEASRAEADPWHFAKARFDPQDADSNQPSREAWLRLEEDVPGSDVLDQYTDDELVEAFLVAEEVESDA